MHLSGSCVQAVHRQQQQWLQAYIVKTLLHQGSGEATTWWSTMSALSRKTSAIVQLTTCLEPLDEKLKRIANRIKTIKKANADKIEKGETTGLQELPDLPTETTPCSIVLGAVEDCNLANIAICDRIKCLDVRQWQALPGRARYSRCPLCWYTVLDRVISECIPDAQNVDIDVLVRLCTPSGSPGLRWCTQLCARVTTLNLL